MIRALLASVADTAVVPLQDVLGLGPRRAHEHARDARRQLALARPREEALAPELAARLGALDAALRAGAEAGAAPHPAAERRGHPSTAETSQESSVSASATRSARQNPIP